MAYRSQPLTRLESYPRRRLALIAIVTLVFSVLLIQAANLSIRQHDRYATQAEGNLTSTGRLSAPRGNIFDRKGQVLATNRRVWDLSFRLGGLSSDDARASLHEIQSLIGTPDDDQIETILETRPRWTTHKLISNLEHEVALPIIERSNDFPGLRINESFVREYTMPYAMAHIVGYMGKIQAGETDTYTWPRYLMDASVGRLGLERAFEDDLAGYPGREQVISNARFRSITEPEILEPARPGKDVVLTIDSELQQTAFDLLGDVTGTVILMDARTGALLVAASNPSFDPLRPGAPEVNGRPAGFMNLAVRGQYPPGSTFKVIGALAAQEAGISPDKTYYCGGYYQVGGKGLRFHCAHRNGHGSIAMADSLKASCNVYYFEVAEEIGADRYRTMAERFGFGSLTGTDLPGEKPGGLPTLEQLHPGERSNFSIGQGLFLSTPIQVARFYGAIATKGTLPTPHIVDAMVDGDGTRHPIDHPQTESGVPASYFREIHKGLLGAVNESGGTAYKARIPKQWSVAGKTGTAERGGGMEDAWFAGYFPAHAPEYVVVVHVEDTDGHGGDVAAPIARDIIAHFKGEIDSKPEQAISTNSGEF